MYTIYTFPVSQHSRRVSSLLDIAGIPYEDHMVDLATGAHLSPEYLAINPNHQVPTLIDGDVKIHESNAILRYICTKEKLSRWYPDALPERALCEQWLDWNQCRLGRAVVDVVFNKVFAGDAGDLDAAARGEAVLPELLENLDDGLQGRDFLIGDQPTVADLSVASNITHLSFVGITPNHENTRNWMTRMLAIDGFNKNVPPAMAA
jgi:glutathione S-transferase